MVGNLVRGMRAIIHAETRRTRSAGSEGGGRCAAGTSGGAVVAPAEVERG